MHDAALLRGRRRARRVVRGELLRWRVRPRDLQRPRARRTEPLRRRPLLRLRAGTIAADAAGAAAAADAIAAAAAGAATAAAAAGTFATNSPSLV